MCRGIPESGSGRWLQSVEGRRDVAGKLRIKVAANPVRRERIRPGKPDRLTNGLNRAVGRTGDAASEVIRDAGRRFGDVFALGGRSADRGLGCALRSDGGGRRAPCRPSGRGHPAALEGR